MTSLLGMSRAAGNRAPTGMALLNQPVAFVSDGDSITQGFGTTNGGYPMLFSAGTNVEALDIAVPGELLSTMLSNLSGVLSPTYFRGRGYTLFTVQGGTNDLGTGGVSAVTLEGTIQSYCAAVRSAGLRVIVGTIISRNDVGSNWSGAKEIQRVAYNTWLRANYATFCDYLMDFDAIPQSQDPNNLTYFQADTVHPTDALQALMYAKMQSMFIPAPLTSYTYNTTPTVGTGTFSSSNKVFLTSAVTANAISTVAISGKKVLGFCWEVSVSADAIGIGFGTAAMSSQAGFDANLSVGFYPHNGLIVQNNAASGYSLPNNSQGTGTLVGMVIDRGANKVWWTLDGTNFYGNSASALTVTQVVAGTGGYDISAVVGTIFAAAGCGNHAGQQIRLIGFPWSVPSGYSQP